VVVFNASTSPMKKGYAVSDSNVIKLAQPGVFTDSLTEVLRSGARALLTQAVEAEVAEVSRKVCRTQARDGPSARRAPRPSSGTLGRSPHLSRGAASDHDGLKALPTLPVDLFNNPPVWFDERCALKQANHSRGNGVFMFSPQQSRFDIETRTKPIDKTALDLGIITSLDTVHSADR
jgi:hypothetical protein